MQLKMYNHFLETGKHEAGNAVCFKNHYNTLHKDNSRLINLVLNSFMPVHKSWIFCYCVSSIFFPDIPYLSTKV